MIAALVDWKAAFDMQDPTIAIQKFIKLGVRSSLIPLLISYLSGRQMRVRLNGELSSCLDLTGGGPQGTLLGLIEYLAQSNDNADCINQADRFKYIDDLTILEIVAMASLLMEYNFFNMLLLMLVVINCSFHQSLTIPKVALNTFMNGQKRI